MRITVEFFDYARSGRMILTASTESEVHGCKASRVSGRMMAARNGKRSGEESDVGQALIGKKRLRCFLYHRAIRVVPRLRSSLFSHQEGMAEGVFCIAENDLCKPRKDDQK